MTYEEEYIEIANRVPPGDKWTLNDNPKEVIEGLVETLNEYVRKTKYKGDYKLAPLQGKLYIINMKEVDEPDPIVYDIYGEGYQQ